MDVQPLRVHWVRVRLAPHERRDRQHRAARLAARRRRLLAAAGAAGRPAQALTCGGAKTYGQGRVQWLATRASSCKSIANSFQLGIQWVTPAM